MLILIITIATLIVFAALIVLAGIKGFFKGATEEFHRQRGVWTRMMRKLKARSIWRKRRKSGLPKEDAQDVESE
ncbi:MAG: hypothetical protein IJK19_00135 [Bacteroidales bacterium]|jgi:hypothetical protein|nr:hypothetical protein [Bacteroidales bacterium]